MHLLAGPQGDMYGLVYSSQPPTYPTAPSILRFDSTGTLRWRHDYPFAFNNNGANLCFTPRGTVLLAGMTSVTQPFSIQARLLEAETSRGDSIGGAMLPLAGADSEFMESRNNSPYEAIGLTSGGYVIPTRVNTVPVPSPTAATGQLTRVDNAYNVVWRYRAPATNVQANVREFTQVRELADGSLLALARNPGVYGRTFWLYRIDGATGALLAIYPFTSALSNQFVFPDYLLPVVADSTLLVVGHNVASQTAPNTGIYIARLRIPNLPRVVTSTASTRVRRAGAWLGMPYPNPAQGWVMMPYAQPAGGRKGARLELRDALGRAVRAVTLPAAATGEVAVALDGLAPGLYLATLVAEGRTQASRRVAVLE